MFEEAAVQKAIFKALGVGVFMVLGLTVCLTPLYLIGSSYSIQVQKK
tara:strand:+ start:426 stop:566 length:141 start_codon:yes stop_codon:yes gene_type:complete